MQAESMGRPKLVLAKDSASLPDSRLE